MTKIEWTEKTINVISGCTKISEGCKNCYAEKMTKRLQAMKKDKYKNGFNEIIFHEDLLAHEFDKLGSINPKMVFVNSMSDTFHKKITDEQIQSILWRCQWNSCCEPVKHTFQLLTKRAERLRHFSYPPSVWLGVTVESAKYLHRIDDLRATNAKVKFISFEPLLSDVGKLPLDGIDLVIVGGESDSNARPMHPDWVRNIQRQCQEQGVPFFFKQWGEWVPAEKNYNWRELDTDGKGNLFLPNTKIKTKDIGIEWDWGEQFCCKVPYDNQTKRILMSKVGKKKAGCLLDGKEWREFPR
jgi:protein gp37